MWPRKVGLMNDYVHVPYANGSSFASQFLYRQLSRRGVEVTVIGPRAGASERVSSPPRTIELDALPLRNHPGVYLSFPSDRGLRKLAGARLDLLLTQTCNAQLFAAAWLRAAHGVPLICVNTVHLPSVYNAVVPEALLELGVTRWFFEDKIVPWIESSTVDVYNEADQVVVLSPGLKRYWESRGVRAQIRVIPRAIETKIFDGVPGTDPFPARSQRGRRLLVVCRHVREKQLARLLRIFARHVLPREPEATLTLVGDGPEHEPLRRLADDLGMSERAFFVGEQPLTEMPAWYAHADAFVYTSLSETFGQVIGEALWCGLPVVAFDDAMGVAGQVADGVDGFLLPPAAPEADAEFARHVAMLLDEPGMRETMGRRARERALERAAPSKIVDAYFSAFDAALRSRQLVHAAGDLAKLAFLRRWIETHALVAGFGLLRRPAVLNRNGSAPPDWDLSALAPPASASATA